MNVRRFRKAHPSRLRRLAALRLGVPELGALRIGALRMGVLSLGLLLTASLLPACSLLSNRDFATLYSLSIPPPPATEDAVKPVAWRLVVARPRADTSLSSPRILVMPQPGVIEVYPKAQWRDSAPVMYGDLILETLEASGRIVALNRANAGFDADYELSGDLRDFQLEVHPAPARVRVRAQLRLLRTRDHFVVATHSFETRAAANAVDVASAVQAFDAALAQQLPEVAQWTIEQAERDWYDSVQTPPIRAPQTPNR